MMGNEGRIADPNANSPIREPSLTTREAWWSTIIFGLLGLAVLIPLVFTFDRELFLRDWRATGLASAIFWGVFGVTMIFAFWKIYYSRFYPAWMRWGAPLNILLYASLGSGMWWLSSKLPGQPVLWFVLLGGIEGIAEHVFGIYVLKILDKVPILQGLTPLPAIIFSFFEYILYWAVVAWMAFAFSRWWC